MAQFAIFLYDGFEQLAIIPRLGYVDLPKPPLPLAIVNAGFEIHWYFADVARWSEIANANDSLLDG